MRIVLAVMLAAGVMSAACRGRADDVAPRSLDAAAESYVRLVLALGERDSDSLDSYHGPAAWQAEAHARHATLAEIRARATALAGSLRAQPDDARRSFLIRQLHAVASRIDILQGARPAFDEEARMLFGIEGREGPEGREGQERQEGQAEPERRDVRAELDRVLPGRGPLAARYAAFDRQFLVAPDRLAAVLARAIEGCRAATRAHVTLPADERVQVEYVRELPWSAFTRYEGHFVSRVRVNVALPLTVDRALDLACHEAYPGHHTIDVLLDSRFGAARPEFFVQPLFSPQSLLHEAAASEAPALAFSSAARTAFERDALFPLAGLDPSAAERHVRVGRLVDRLHGVEAIVARQYLDGALDFPRAAAALERDALMGSADATLTFLNQFRSYAATYTIGRDRLSATVRGSWVSYIDVVSDAAQTISSPRNR
jgi:hypothetical protein